MINKMADRILYFYEKQGVVSDIFQSLILISAFVFFFPPRMLMTIDIYTKIDLYIKLLMAMYVYTISFCYLIRYRKLPLLIILVNLYCGFVFISTVVNHGDLKSAIWGNWIIASAMTLLLWNSMERNPDWCLRTLWLVFYVAILINLHFVINLWQVGKRIKSMEKTFLFGNYNGFILWFLPAQVIGYIIWNKSKKFIDKLLYLVLCVLNFGVIIYVKSSTSLVVLTLFNLYMLFLNKEVTKKIFNIHVYLIGNLLFFISIVVLRIQNGVIEYIVSHLMSDMTFSGRTPIWDNAISLIRNNIFMGLGIQPMEIKKDALVGFGTVHNMGLDILYTGGIIAMFLFAAIVISVVIKISKSPQIDYPIIGCFSAFLGSFFLSAQFESHTLMVSLMYLSIVYFILDACVKKRFG